MQRYNVEINDVSKHIIVDPYWTPIGYFNNEELSGALSSIEDAIIQQHIPEFASRSGTKQRQVPIMKNCSVGKEHMNSKQPLVG